MPDLLQTPTGIFSELLTCGAGNFDSGIFLTIIDQRENSMPILLQTPTGTFSELFTKGRVPCVLCFRHRQELYQNY